MLKRKILYYGVLALLLVTPSFLFMAKLISSKHILVWFPIILICTGIWALLRKRILGIGKVKSFASGQALVSPSAPISNFQAGRASGTQFGGPKVRHDKNFIVEDNLDAIQWPDECCWCGGAVEHRETLNLKEKFKGEGQIQAQVVGIPYCKKCIGRARWTHRINTVVIASAVIIGLAMTLYVKFQELTGRITGGYSFAIIFLICVAIGYGISWFFFKMPFKLFFRKKLVEPVSAWFMQDHKSNGQEGISVVISIPKKDHADKFARMNVTAASSSIPVSEIDDQTLVRVIQPVSAEPEREIRSKVPGKVEGIDYLIECTRDDIMDTDDLWARAVNDLQQHGEDGSNALAGLIREMLRCRAGSIGIAIALSRNLLPTEDLINVLTDIRSARSLTSTIFGARFQPQIEGGGMIGWTDGTSARIKAAAASALDQLMQPIPPCPDVIKMEAEKDIQGLIEALSFRTDMRLREAVAQALGRIGDKQAVGALETALKDGSLPVRIAAKEALALINNT